MKLSDLIKHLRSPENLRELLIDVSPSEETESIEVYLEDSLDLSSEVYFFEVEETEGDLVFEKAGISYFSFFFTFVCLRNGARYFT